ncbi:hypothetical protein [Aureibacter tunicatorum]|uniref:Uncharacterized protein n=1 Tax=Aureibacter tunicatorum TaxID=866807 RepID=A0AAE4BTW8_9BACT|nr:hypothetical protein [Aureibacter tunicatorum]MDR6240370.1 hypothetical protein [Aureibacter tunicatorum]BDD05749.1 hypothetical protein AUTU_32320 [Aureibacter tunicatorum]
MESNNESLSLTILDDSEDFVGEYQIEDDFNEFDQFLDVFFFEYDN